jgi:hypothetical protein
MMLGTRATTVLTRSLLAAALMVAALLLYTHAAATASTARGAARAKPVVGEVVALGGSKRLHVRQSSGGSLRPLKTGDKLRLGDHLVMGSRVTATLHLDRPKGVAADTELIDLAPAAGASHDVAVSRKGSLTTVEITPGASSAPAATSSTRGHERRGAQPQRLVGGGPSRRG